MNTTTVKAVARLMLETDVGVSTVMAGGMWLASVLAVVQSLAGYVPWWQLVALLGLALPALQLLWVGARWLHR